MNQNESADRKNVLKKELSRVYGTKQKQARTLFTKHPKI